MPAAKPTSQPASKGSKLPIFFLLLTVCMLAAGGYYVYSTVKSGAGISNPLDMAKQIAGSNLSMLKVTENDFKDIEDPLIRKHLVAQITVGKYRIISTSDGMDTGQEQIMEFVMNNDEVNYRVVQKMNGKDVSDMITIGDVTYLKDFKDNTWWKQKAEPSEDLAASSEEISEQFKPMDLKEEFTKSNVTYKDLGEEACGTLTCHKYQEISSESEGATRTFWFDKKELLLRKEMNGYGEFTSIQEYSYDNLSVKAPSPTKDVPEGKSIYDYMVTSMMSEDEAKAFQEAKSMMPSQEKLEQMMKDIESGDTSPIEELYTEPIEE